MKNLIASLLFLMTTNVLAKEYRCQDKRGQNLIMISLTKNASKFRYTKDNKVILDLRMPLPTVIYGNDWNTDRVYLGFNPNWGESTVNIYARISRYDNSLFDIYVKGMAGNFQGLLSNYRCELF